MNTQFMGIGPCRDRLTRPLAGGLSHALDFSFGARVAARRPGV